MYAIKCSSCEVRVVEGSAGHANSGKLNKQELYVHVTGGVRKQEDKSLEEGNTQLGNTVKSWGTWGSSSRFGGVAGTWCNLAYSPRHPREPNMPSRAKCHVIFLMLLLSRTTSVAPEEMAASISETELHELESPTEMGRRM